MKNEAGKLEALVYNTTGLNDCPPAKYDPMDAKELAQKTQIGCGMEESPALLDDGPPDIFLGRRTPRL